MSGTAAVLDSRGDSLSRERERGQDTAAAPALLRVDNVSLEYRTPQRLVRATHRVSFDVHAADRFVLLGPSGCGKSTLLKAVAGFIPPVEGEIRIDGRRVAQPGPDRIVVFQEFDQLPPWKTVKQNVMFPLQASRTLGKKEAAEQGVWRLPGIVGVTNLITIRPTVDVSNIRDDITHALNRSWFFDPQTIEVRAEGGRVKLSGTVQSQHERQIAAATAWRAPGVTEVFNDLVVA